MNKNFIWIVAIFFWGIGLHKVFLWKFFQAFLYLIFSFTLFPAIIWMIEWLNYLCMTQEKFDQAIKAKNIKQKIAWKLETEEQRQHFVVWLVAIILMVWFYLKYYI